MLNSPSSQSGALVRSLYTMIDLKAAGLQLFASPRLRRTCLGHLPSKMNDWRTCLPTLRCSDEARVRQPCGVQIAHLDWRRM